MRGNDVEVVPVALKTPFQNGRAHVAFGQWRRLTLKSTEVGQDIELSCPKKSGNCSSCGAVRQFLHRTSPEKNPPSCTFIFLQEKEGSEVNQGSNQKEKQKLGIF